MPFDGVAPKPSLAEQLAALIDAGRVAHPNVQHSRGHWGDGVHSGCAMTFAFLAVGVDTQRGLARRLGCKPDDLKQLLRRVINANDKLGYSLAGITAGLRANTLPEPPLEALLLTGHEAQVIAQALESSFFTVALGAGGISVWFTGKQPTDPKSPSLAEQTSFVVKKVYEAGRAHVRTSARTGATWPVPKHCYA
jgi:hypothetical protein